jgi:hypothetical protein
MATYEILEFNQDQNIDEIYNHAATHPVFFNMRKLKRYIRDTNVYGRVFEFDDTEWAEYNNADDDDCSIDKPEPLQEYITNELIEGQL